MRPSGTSFSRASWSASGVVPRACDAASRRCSRHSLASGWKAAGILPGTPVCEGHPLPGGREARPGDMVSPGEVIQHHHRYMVAPPSTHPSGRRYRWLGGNMLPVSYLPVLEGS